MTEYHEFNQDTLQQRLQKLIDTAREPWTYAIFWLSSDLEHSGPPVLGWGDGYYEGEQNKSKTVMSATSLAEQEYRKKVLREVFSMIPGTQAPENDEVDEEVSDTEWFFLLSMTQSFIYGIGLPGQAMRRNQPVWVTGGKRLMTSHCERAREGQGFGLQTIVCIPSAHGVIELGSTELIYQSSDIMKKVRGSFNFNDQEGNFYIHAGNLSDELFYYIQALRVKHSYSHGQGSSHIHDGNLSHEVGGVSGQAPSIGDMVWDNMSPKSTHSYSHDGSAPTWNDLYIRDSSTTMTESDNLLDISLEEFEQMRIN